ncbi:hypothetical protein L7F22_056910 [Adiantum nelumboides]|nr:hypothetical protein [Adiantum nelumboides]
MADNNEEGRINVDSFDFANEGASEETPMLVNYLITRLQQAMENPALQGEVQQQLQAYGFIPPHQEERILEKSLGETSKRGTSKVRDWNDKQWWASQETNFIVYALQKSLMKGPMDSFTREAEAGDDDTAFLSAIAEAEADGLRRLLQEGENSSRKHDRQHAEPAEKAASKRPRLEPEGEYMAAHRGTHSEAWQAMTSKARYDVKPRYGAASSAFANLGFDNGGLQGRNLAERSCPCGGGLRKVLIANTEKNVGRQFYRCPPRKEGQCGFFEWCNSNTSTSQGLSKERGGNQNPLELSCPCGASFCITLTAKTEKNMGRQFYRCPLNQGEGSCGFFKWRDENLPATSTTPA